MDITAYAKKLERMADEQVAAVALAGPEQGFLPEAIAAARDELSNRNIDSGEFAQLESGVAEKRLIYLGAADEPLPRSRWILIAVVGSPVFFLSIIFIVMNYANRGYKRKAKEAFLALLAGFALWGLISVLLSLAISVA